MGKKCVDHGTPDSDTTSLHRPPSTQIVKDGHAVFDLREIDHHRDFREGDGEND